MIGLRRMQNVRSLLEDVLNRNVPGDAAECGVWKGGTAIFMASILEAYQSEKKVWVCDSFQGMPMPIDRRDPDWSDKRDLAISLSEVKAHFHKHGVLQRALFVKGWFEETLPGPIGQLSLLRVDCDLYSSTIAVLEALYPKLSPGGYVIIDDYNGPATPVCKEAVDDYRRDHGIVTPLEIVDWCAVYWRKE